MKIAITGATGFIGTRLVQSLHADGHAIVILSRNPDRGARIFPAVAFPSVSWVVYQPLQSGDWQQAIDGCDAVINLAGEPIAEGRWTSERKQTILDSRKVGTEKIVEAIARASLKPTVLINASAVGYYGTSETATFDENSPAGNDFLAEVCQAWEAAALKVKDTSTRLVILRTGIVLEQDGGALGKMLAPFRLFAGGPLGTGQQWLSWIHREDMVNLIRYALNTPTLMGTFNATAPNPVRMHEFCQILGDVLKRPSWLPVPEFALEALLGDAAKLVLEGQKVLPLKTQSAGFSYTYPSLKSALEAILK